MALEHAGGRSPRPQTPTWLELSIHVPYEYVEPIAELFRRYGKGGVVIEETTAFNPDEGEMPPSRSSATVRTYMPATASYRTNREMVHIGVSLISQLHPLPALQERTVTTEEWESAWKAHFPLLRVGSRLVMSAPFHDYAPREGEVVVRVDPGLAFGTGHHPTTYRCLENLERLLIPGCRVVDVGSGSGILAIAAAKLGAGAVTGVEIDRVALRVGRANVRANGVEGAVRCYLGSVPHRRVASHAADLVLANLNATVLTGLAPALREAMKPGGWLIASGVLEDRRSQVERAFTEAGLNVREAAVDDDWVTLLAYGS